MGTAPRGGQSQEHQEAGTVHGSGSKMFSTTKAESWCTMGARGGLVGNAELAGGGGKMRFPPSPGELGAGRMSSAWARLWDGDV